MIGLIEEYQKVFIVFAQVAKLSDLSSLHSFLRQDYFRLLYGSFRDWQSLFII